MTFGKLESWLVNTHFLSSEMFLTGVMADQHMRKAARAIVMTLESLAPFLELETSLFEMTYFLPYDHRMQIRM